MNTLSWIVDGSFSTRLTVALLHFVWQGCAGGMLVIVGGWLLRGAAARTRYSLNVAAMLLMAACLPVTFFLVGSSDAVTDRPMTSQNARESQVSHSANAEISDHSTAHVLPTASQVTGSGAPIVESNPRTEAGGTPTEVASSRVAPAVWLPSLISTLTDDAFSALSRWVAVVYLTGVALILGRLLRGVWGGHRLRKMADIVEDAALLEMVCKLAHRLGLKVVPTVAWCEQISIPVVVGIVTPMILLPMAVVSGLTPGQLQGLILHELSHIRRFDPVVNLLQRIIEAMLFFHPVVWFVSRRISIEREHAADDMVLAAGWDRPLYADALVRVAELASAISGPDIASRATVLGAAGTNPSEFKRRVLRLLGDPHPPKLDISRAGIAVTLLFVVMGGVFAWSQTDKRETTGDRRDPVETANADPTASPAEQPIPKQKVETAGPPDGLEPIRVMLKLNRKEFLLGESIAIDYEMTNDGTEEAPYGKGGFYPDLRINDGFRMSAVKVDESGKPIGEPVGTWPMPQNFGGKVGGFKLKPGEKFSTTLFVTRYLQFLEPGRYRLRVSNVDRLEHEPKSSYSSGETYLALKQPTLEEARRVFELMKQAPRTAYDDNAMKFLQEAVDFQAMHQPVYLPILKEFATKSDRDALQSLERMEQVEANEILVATMAGALDRDDWRTARACFQHLKTCLPFPNWFNEPLGEHDQPNRDRVARLWKPAFVPTLTRLAKRLNVEVTSLMQERKSQPLDTDANDREFLKVFRNGYFPPEHPQSLLVDIDFIYRCVGQPDDFNDCLAAYAHSIELTKTSPLETNQYFRPRGSASGFGHTVIYMLRRGAKVPNQPTRPGEAAAFAIALRQQDSFRPAGWQAELMKWLKSDSPYLAEVILNTLPTPIPADVLDYLPTALTHDYIDLQIAACEIARKNPRPAYREPLQKVLDTAKDEYLRKYAVDAARANGIKAKYDANAPFVDAEKENAATTAPPDGVRTLRKPALLLPDHWIVMSVVFDNESKELVTASTQSFVTIRRWDVVGKKLISEIKLAGDKHGRSFHEGTLTLSGDRRKVIAATDAYVGIWETATGSLIKKLPIPKVGDNDTVRLLACTPDFSLIVGSLETNYDRTTLVYDAHTVVWDGTTGKMLRILTHKHATRLHAITLSADGQRLATTNGSGATIWDTSTGQQLHHVQNDNTGRKHFDPATSSLYTNHVWSIHFSPNRKQLAIGDILGVKLVDANSGKLLQQLEAPYSYSSGHSPNLVFSKDGKLLARLGTGDESGGTSTGYVVPIWSTQTGQKLFELQTNANDGAFSDDGQRFAVGFSDLQFALSIWPLSGDAVNAEQIDGPGAESRQDKVEENGHYHGKKAAEFIDTFKPTWNDAQPGIQYGIALTKPQRQFRIGERVPLVVFFRNASDKPLKIDMRPDFFGNTPKVLDAKGAAVEFENVPLLGSIPHYVENLEPGEAVGPFYLNFGLGENPRPGKQNWHPYYKTPVAGTYKLAHTVSIEVGGPKDGDEAKRAELTSGTIEFEIVEGGKDP